MVSLPNREFALKFSMFLATLDIFNYLNKGGTSKVLVASVVQEAGEDPREYVVRVERLSRSCGFGALQAENATCLRFCMTCRC